MSKQEKIHNHKLKKGRLQNNIIYSGGFVIMFDKRKRGRNTIYEKVK